MGSSQHGGPRLEGLRGLASVHDGWCQQTDAPVSVLLVVPVKEAAAEVEAVVMAGEAAWKIGSVLQRLELTLREGIVVTDVRSAVGLGHPKGCQQLRHGLGSHGWTSVAVDRQLIAVDPFFDERLANQSFGEMLRFPVSKHPSHDVAAVDVEDHVEVVVGPLCGRFNSASNRRRRGLSGTAGSGRCRRLPLLPRHPLPPTTASGIPNILWFSI